MKLVAYEIIESTIVLTFMLNNTFSYTQVVEYTPEFHIVLEEQFKNK